MGRRSIDVGRGVAGGLAGAAGGVAHASSATSGNAASALKPSALVERRDAPDDREHALGVDDGGELAVEVGQGDRVDLLRGIPESVRPDAVEGGGGIGNDPGVESEISRHAGRRRDAVVGGQPGDDQGLVGGSSQLRLERGPDEAAIHALLDHPLVWSWRRLDLERVPGLVGAQGRGGVGRHVFHVDDRTFARAPGVEQLCDPRFHRRVVPPPPLRRVESLLDVDDEQQGLKFW